MSKPRKVIIDTDPGIDDALAIFLALASPEIEVIGLTSVFGNAAIDVTTRNALALLEIAGSPDIPVAAGAAGPRAGEWSGPVPHVHGEDGQGNAGMAEPGIKALSVPAADFLFETASNHPGEVTIVALGPLTNLAQALEAHPGIAHDVAGVVMMGGNALVPGNATPAAEANIFNDPEAADIVFGAPWPVAMVGLDVTHKALLTDPAIEKLCAAPNPANRHIAAALPLYREFSCSVGVDGVYLHDPSAVAFVIDETLFRTERWPIRVETTGIGRGKTWPWTRRAKPPTGEWEGRPAVEVCVDVEADRLIELVVNHLS